jgi:hypothetical protein
MEMAATISRAIFRKNYRLTDPAVQLLAALLQKSSVNVPGISIIKQHEFFL